MSDLSQTDTLRAAVRAALEELGDSADAVAARLLADGCFGFSGEGNRCPVARYLSQRFHGEDFGVDPDAVALIEYDEERETPKVVLPWPVQDFVFSFDRDGYPDLTASKGEEAGPLTVMSDGTVVIGREQCTRWSEDPELRARARRIGRATGNRLFAVCTPGGFVVDVWQVDHWQSGLEEIAHAPTEPPPSSPLDPMRSGAQNEDESEHHGCMCSLVEFDDTDDACLLWYVRVRDGQDDEEISVVNVRQSEDWSTLGGPPRFHRAALSFVRSRVDFSEV